MANLKHLIFLLKLYFFSSFQDYLHRVSIPEYLRQRRILLQKRFQKIKRKKSEIRRAGCFTHFIGLLTYNTTMGPALRNINCNGVALGFYIIFYNNNNCKHILLNNIYIYIYNCHKACHQGRQNTAFIGRYGGLF